jgi:uncharacterized membrane protein YhaH (DUF805 family)
MPLPSNLPAAPTYEVVVVPVDARRIANALGMIAVILIAVGVTTSLAYDAVDRREDWWFRFVDVNGEGNLPAWYSVLLLAGVALLVFALAHVRRAKNLGESGAWNLLGWFVVAMSLDEMTSIHEAVGGQIDERATLPLISGYGWIVPGTFAAACGAWVGWRVMSSLPGHARRSLTIAAAVFVTGALMLEVVEAVITNKTGTFGTAAQLVTGAQELCEMLGVVLVVRVLVRELRRLSIYADAERAGADADAVSAA